jgi:hypothetical protein
VASALGLWLELAVRAAAVSVAVLFLPLALAAMVWPAVSHWCRRLADTLVALILSKLVIAAVLALAVGALAGGLGVGTSGGNDGGFSAVVTGIALLGIATVSPFTLLRLIPAMEAGAAAHLESSRRQLISAAKAPLEEGKSMAMDIVNRKPDSPVDATPGTSAGAGLAGTGPSADDKTTTGAATGGATGEAAPGSSTANPVPTMVPATHDPDGTGATFTGLKVKELMPNEAHYWRKDPSNGAGDTGD